MSHPEADDEYTWPKCTACHRDLWADETDRWACRPCQDRTAIRLRELPALFAHINSTAALMRGASRSSGTPTGTRVPPIPPHLEVLSLAAVGGVATRLQAVEDDWRKVLGRRMGTWPGSPGEAVPKHVAFLAINLQWACERYDAIGQDVEEIRRLHTECTSALSGERKAGLIPIGACPVATEHGRCGQQLTATTRKEAIKCRACGTEWPDREAWKTLRDTMRTMALEAAAA